MRTHNGNDNEPLGNNNDDSDIALSDFTFLNSTLRRSSNSDPSSDTDSEYRDDEDSVNYYDELTTKIKNETYDIYSLAMEELLDIYFQPNAVIKEQVRNGSDLATLCGDHQYHQFWGDTLSPVWIHRQEQLHHINFWARLEDTHRESFRSNHSMSTNDNSKAIEISNNNNSKRKESNNHHHAHLLTSWMLAMQEHPDCGLTHWGDKVDLYPGCSKENLVRLADSDVDDDALTRENRYILYARSILASLLLRDDETENNKRIGMELCLSFTVKQKHSLARRFSNIDSPSKSVNSPQSGSFSFADDAIQLEKFSSPTKSIMISRILLDKSTRSMAFFSYKRTSKIELLEKCHIDLRHCKFDFSLYSISEIKKLKKKWLNLEGHYLEGIVLKDIIHHSLILNGSFLADATIENIQSDYMGFVNTTLFKSNFYQCQNLYKANFSSSIIMKCDFRHCNLEHSNMTADIKQAMIYGNMMKGSNPINFFKHDTIVDTKEVGTDFQELKKLLRNLNRTRQSYGPISSIGETGKHMIGAKSGRTKLKENDICYRGVVEYINNFTQHFEYRIKKPEQIRMAYERFKANPSDINKKNVTAIINNIKYEKCIGGIEVSKVEAIHSESWDRYRKIVNQDAERNKESGNRLFNYEDDMFDHNDDYLSPMINPLTNERFCFHGSHSDVTPLIIKNGISSAKDPDINKIIFLGKGYGRLGLGVYAADFHKAHTYTSCINCQEQFCSCGNEVRQIFLCRVALGEIVNESDIDYLKYKKHQDNPSYQSVHATDDEEPGLRSKTTEFMIVSDQAEEADDDDNDNRDNKSHQQRIPHSRIYPEYLITYKVHPKKINKNDPNLCKLSDDIGIPLPSKIWSYLSLNMQTTPQDIKIEVKKLEEILADYWRLVYLHSKPNRHLISRCLGKISNSLSDIEDCFNNRSDCNDDNDMVSFENKSLSILNDNINIAISRLTRKSKYSGDTSVAMTHVHALLNISRINHFKEVQVPCLMNAKERLGALKKEPARGHIQAQFIFGYLASGQDKLAIHKLLMTKPPLTRVEQSYWYDICKIYPKIALKFFIYHFAIHSRDFVDNKKFFEGEVIIVSLLLSQITNHRGNTTIHDNYIQECWDSVKEHLRHLVNNKDISSNPWMSVSYFLERAYHKMSPIDQAKPAILSLRRRWCLLPCNPTGIRRYAIDQREQWETEILPSLMEDCDDNNQSVTIDWLSHNGMIHRNKKLKSSYVKQLLKNGKINTDKQERGSRCLVIPFNDSTEKTIAYIKFYPIFPMRQILAELIIERMHGVSALSSFAKMTINGEVIPIIISKALPDNMHKSLEARNSNGSKRKSTKKEHFENLMSELDDDGFFEHFLESFIMRYSDEKFNNASVVDLFEHDIKNKFIIHFDLDEYLPEDIQDSSRKLKVNSFVFLMEKMLKKTISDEAKARFAYLDWWTLIEEVIRHVYQLSKHVSQEDKSKSLFDKKEIKYFRHLKTAPRIFINFDKNLKVRMFDLFHLNALVGFVRRAISCQIQLESTNSADDNHAISCDDILKKQGRRILEIVKQAIDSAKQQGMEENIHEYFRKLNNDYIWVKVSDSESDALVESESAASSNDNFPTHERISMPLSSNVIVKGSHNKKPLKLENVERTCKYFIIVNKTTKDTLQHEKLLLSRLKASFENKSNIDDLKKTLINDISTPSLILKLLANLSLTRYRNNANTVDSYHITMNEITNVIRDKISEDHEAVSVISISGSGIHVDNLLMVLLTNNNSVKQVTLKDYQFNNFEIYNLLSTRKMLHNLKLVNVEFDDRLGFFREKEVTDSFLQKVPYIGAYFTEAEAPRQFGSLNRLKLINTNIKTITTDTNDIELVNNSNLISIKIPNAINSFKIKNCPKLNMIKNISYTNIAQFKIDSFNSELFLNIMEQYKLPPTLKPYQIQLLAKYNSREKSTVETIIKSMVCSTLFLIDSREHILRSNLYPPYNSSNYHSMGANISLAISINALLFSSQGELSDIKHKISKNLKRYKISDKQFNAISRIMDLHCLIHDNLVEYSENIYANSREIEKHFDREIVDMLFGIFKYTISNSKYYDDLNQIVECDHTNFVMDPEKLIGLSKIAKILTLTLLVSPNHEPLFDTPIPRTTLITKIITILSPYRREVSENLLLNIFALAGRNLHQSCNTDIPLHPNYNLENHNTNVKNIGYDILCLSISNCTIEDYDNIISFSLPHHIHGKCYIKHSHHNMQNATYRLYFIDNLPIEPDKFLSNFITTLSISFSGVVSIIQDHMLSPIEQISLYTKLWSKANIFNVPKICLDITTIINQTQKHIDTRNTIALESKNHLYRKLTGDKLSLVKIIQSFNERLDKQKNYARMLNNKLAHNIPSLKGEIRNERQLKTYLRLLTTPDHILNKLSARNESFDLIKLNLSNLISSNFLNHDRLPLSKPLIICRHENPHHKIYKLAQSHSQQIMRDNQRHDDNDDDDEVSNSNMISTIHFHNDEYAKMIDKNQFSVMLSDSNHDNATIYRLLKLVYDNPKELLDNNQETIYFIGRSTPCIDIAVLAGYILYQNNYYKKDDKAIFTNSIIKKHLLQLRTSHYELLNELIEEIVFGKNEEIGDSNGKNTKNKKNTDNIRIRNNNPKIKKLQFNINGGIINTGCFQPDLMDGTQYFDDYLRNNNQQYIMAEAILSLTKYDIIDYELFHEYYINYLFKNNIEENLFSRSHHEDFAGILKYCKLETLLTILQSERLYDHKEFFILYALFMSLKKLSVNKLPNSVFYTLLRCTNLDHYMNKTLLDDFFGHFHLDIIEYIYPDSQKLTEKADSEFLMECFSESRSLPNNLSRVMQIALGKWIEYANSDPSKSWMIALHHIITVNDITDAGCKISALSACLKLLENRHDSVINDVNVITQLFYALCHTLTYTDSHLIKSVKQLAKQLSLNIDLYIKRLVTLQEQNLPEGYHERIKSHLLITVISIFTAKHYNFDVIKSLITMLCYQNTFDDPSKNIIAIENILSNRYINDPSLTEYVLRQLLNPSIDWFNLNNISDEAQEIILSLYSDNLALFEKNGEFLQIIQKVYNHYSSSKMNHQLTSKYHPLFNVLIEHLSNNIPKRFIINEKCFLWLNPVMKFFINVTLHNPAQFPVGYFDHFIEKLLDCLLKTKCQPSMQFIHNLCILIAITKPKYLFLHTLSKKLTDYKKVIKKVILSNTQLSKVNKYVDNALERLEHMQNRYLRGNQDWHRLPKDFMDDLKKIIDNEVAGKNKHPLFADYSEACLDFIITHIVPVKAGTNLFSVFSTNDNNNNNDNLELSINAENIASDDNDGEVDLAMTR